MPLLMRFYEDVLRNGQSVEFAAPRPQAIYVAAGGIDAGGQKIAHDNGLVSTEALSLTAGEGGACLWRWELANGQDDPALIGDPSTLKLQPEVFDHDISQTHLLRLDSVAFPPGGCALRHTHQGPGIRCLIEGRIRIDAGDHSHAFGPGSPWFEAGPDPVIAQADATIPSRFIRAMALPRELVGKSSIRYVNADDQDKPKSQTYRVFDEKLLG